jgi:hypothetical protein
VFEQNLSGKQREYKITIIASKQGSPDPASLSEFQQLVQDGYQIKDLFYSDGLKVIFER